MTMKNNFILFLLGAFLYGLIEIIWRGYSHWTMMLAGGICLIIFSIIDEKFKNVPMLYKCILGSACVTSIEFVFGVVFNIFLKQQIWDYSRVPLNLLGQVCLLYSVLWGFLCLAAIPFSGLVKRKLENKTVLAGGSNFYELSAQGMGRN